MRPHLTFTVRPGLPHAPVGSWLELAGGSAVTGPPFEPTIDHVFASHRVDVAIVHEHDPASPRGWAPDEQVLGLDRKFRAICFAPGVFPADVVHELRALPVVERADLGLVASAVLPLARSQSRTPSGWAGDAIALEDAQRVTQGDAQITIAVLDTGIWPSHPEYRDRLEPGFDFVDVIDGAGQFFGDRLGADADPTDPGVGHGSHVTGILVATGKRMPRGVAPGCRILPVRVLGALRQGTQLIGAGLVDNINAGIKWAVDQGATVINMSLGIRHDGGGLPHADAVRYALRRGVSIVAAAGNDGASTLYYPGALPSVTAVGAFGQDGEIAHYSTWGSQVSLVAPGTDIWSSWLDDEYAFATGTSQATPYVSGALALCQSLAADQGTRFSPRQAADLLQATADRPGRRFRDTRAGYGRLNVSDALRLATYRLEAPQAVSPRSGRRARGVLTPA